MADKIADKMADEGAVRLSVPAEARYARLVRMTVANLAVLCDLGVEEVEDLRMIAEEGFVLSCATHPASCDIELDFTDGRACLDFALGDADPAEAGTDLDLVRLLLEAVCDTFDVEGATLRLTKTIGQANAR
jgi:serine/threonine-protein kinase RsbW